MESVKEIYAERKIQQKRDFDRHRGSRELSDLTPGDTVWVPDSETEATVRDKVVPRSYVVVTPDGGVTRKNRKDVIRMNDATEGVSQTDEATENDTVKPSQPTHHDPP